MAGGPTAMPAIAVLGHLMGRKREVLPHVQKIKDVVDYVGFMEVR